MYQKEKNQITVHKTAADMVRRDEANKKLAFAAGNKIKPVLKQLDSRPLSTLSAKDGD